MYMQLGRKCTRILSISDYRVLICVRQQHLIYMCTRLMSFVQYFSLHDSYSMEYKLTQFTNGIDSINIYINVINRAYTRHPPWGHSHECTYMNSSHTLMYITALHTCSGSHQDLRSTINNNKAIITPWYAVHIGYILTSCCICCPMVVFCVFVDVASEECCLVFETWPFVSLSRTLQ